MNRRDMLRALAAGLVSLPAVGGRRRPRRRDDWEFRLGGDQRWSLVGRDGAAAVAGAEVAVQLAGGASVALGDLDDVRRFELTPPRGGSTGWQVVGTLDGVEVTATFFNGPPPTITVSARGLAAERALAEIRFLDSGRSRVAALRGGAGSPRAARLWINGAASASDCRVVAADAGFEGAGHWQLAVLPAGAAGGGLALAFGTGDAGDGQFTVAGGVLVSAIFAGRPVGMALPPASASLAIVPSADPLAALGQLSTAALPGRKVPSGWSSAHALAGGATEDELLANLAAARNRADAQAFRLVQLDAGYERSAGDWETNDRFPHGHRWLTDRIHEAGFQAGLWLAPFAVAERSGIPTAHPEWLLQAPDGSPLPASDDEASGGRVYGLDAAQAPVQDFLRELARHVVDVWGYDFLKLGALELGAQGTRAGRRMSGAEAYRAGLRALREGAGAAFLLGCDAPLQHAAGLVDAMRVTPEVGGSFGAFVPAARALTLRAHLNGAAWVNDADAVLVGDTLTDDEARTWASVVALSGATALASDDLTRLPDERLAILQRVMPVAPVRGRALDVASPAWTGAAADAAPAWLLAQAAEDWWTLAAVNWDDVPQQLSLSLAEHGIRGPLAAYDVWAGIRLGDVTHALALALPVHGAVVLSLRRPRRRPFVLGSTRHVVQGVMDLEDEQWDPARRVLAARAVLLDGRPYEVTIALPPGFHPKDARCEPGAEITVEMAERGAARLRIPKPPGAELDWSVRF